MRRSNLLGTGGLAAAATSVLGGVRPLPAVKVSRGLGHDGTEFDPGRTTSKRTKRLAHLPDRYAEAHQAKRKAARTSAKHARRATT